MKKRFLLTAVFAFSIAVVGCQKKSTEDVPSIEESQPIVESEMRLDKAPEFNLKTVDGKDVKLSDFKGKIVLIDFWATWCGPCRIGVPDLVELQEEYKDELVVIGISFDRVTGTEKDLLPFMQQYKINYIVAHGTDEVSIRYGNIQAIPTSFIIDKDGNVQNKFVGLVPKSTYVTQLNRLTGKS